MSGNFPFDHFLNISKEQNSQTQSSTSIPSIPLPFIDNQTQNQFSFKELLTYLQKLIPKQKFQTYFANDFSLAEIDRENLEIIFSVPSPFVESMIQQHYVAFIGSFLNECGMNSYKIIFQINNTIQAVNSASSEKNILKKANDLISNKTETNNNSSKPRFKLNLDINESTENLLNVAESSYLNHVKNIDSPTLIDRDKTFETFVVGHSNQLAFATAKVVASSPCRPGKPNKYPSLYIHGPSGIGKTHLLHSIANSISENFPELSICFISGRNFMKEMIKSIQDNTFNAFQKKYSEKVDVLLLDDIHELENKPGTQNEFFHIFNELYNKNKQLIFTSDKLPSTIQGLEERLKTRLQWGLLVDIQRPDFETRVAILKKKAVSMDLYLNEEILHTIASHASNSIRELEGCLMKLYAFSDVMKTELDLETIKQLLAFKNESENSKPSIEEIAKDIAKHSKILLPDLVSKSRNKDITFVRHIAMYKAHKQYNYTLNEIGIFFGNRDHSTVLSGVNKITSEIAAKNLKVLELLGLN